MLGQLQSLFYAPASCSLPAAAAAANMPPQQLVLATPPGCAAAASYSVMPNAMQQQYSAYLTALMLAGDSQPSIVYQPIRVNWATSPSNLPKQDVISKYSQEDLRHHYHIFVGDLSPDIETHQLREAFSAFGDVSDAKIIKDTLTQKSKGYGFISFAKREEAQKAIAEMNGAWLGSRAIRTNWATRKPAGMSSGDKQQQLLLQQLGPGNPTASPHQGKLNYEEVYAQSSLTNCTVYVGGLTKNLSEEVLMMTFSPFGTIKEVRVFKEKGYAFVRFATKDAATKAICDVHGTDVAGNLVKCSWGKESNDQISAFAPHAQQQPYGYGGQYYGAQSAAAYSASSFYSPPAASAVGGTFNGTATQPAASAYTSAYPSYASSGYADYASYGNFGQYGAYGQ